VSENARFLVPDLVTSSSTALVMLSSTCHSSMSTLLGIISKSPAEVCCSGAPVVSVCSHATCFSIFKEQQQVYMYLYEQKLITCCKNFVWGFLLTLLSLLYDKTNRPCTMCSVHVISKTQWQRKILARFVKFWWGGVHHYLHVKGWPCISGKQNKIWISVTVMNFSTYCW